MSKFVDGLIDFILADATPVTPAEQPDVAAFDAAIAAGARQSEIAKVMADHDVTQPEAEQMLETEALMDGSDWQRRHPREQQ
jgi:hypothetical protein